MTGGKSMKKILVVDDEPELVKALQIRLQENYKLIVASDGEEGLKKAKEIVPDLIILDIILPGIDGYQVCQALKRDEKYKHIPVIMLTVKAQQQDIVKGYKDGANIYLTKPFEIQELLSSVKTLIK